ncbi:TIGR01244 family sulfur transferase [Piscinibacter sp.]|uniref:TIGR01244 family sulfur transferase n=1 Tax=Piscinibacter sp. TaxID=1903157 RepID=UPI0039E491A3
MIPLRQLLRNVAPDVCVAPQLEPAAMAELAALGFKSVVNNRPDYEEGPDQPTDAQMAAAAAAAGLAYAYLPVQPAYQSPEEIARMAALLASLPRPMVAFCRSGTRSGKLYAAATAR